MEPNLPRVSVVIPTFMRRDRLSAVIRPLVSEKATFEILVVIDGGRDGSYELVQKWGERDPRVCAVMTDHQGRAGAQQAGVDLACGEIVLLLDDDVVPAPDLVRRHAAHHRSAENLVVVGYMPVTLPPSPNAKDWVAARYAARYESTVRCWEEQPQGILLGLWGGNVSIRRADLQRVPVRCTGSEIRYHIDLEWGLRCWKAGLHAVFDRRLLAGHAYSRTARQFLNDRAASAADKAAIHRLHADAVGPLRDDFFRREVAGVRRSILDMMPRGSIPMEFLLHGVVEVATTARWYQTEHWAADLLVRMRSQRIVHEWNHQDLRREIHGGGRAGGRSRQNQSYSQHLQYEPDAASGDPQ